MLVSRRIGKDLSNTFAKLEKLTICECSWGLSEMGQCTREGWGTVLPEPCLWPPPSWPHLSLQWQSASPSSMIKQWKSKSSLTSSNRWAASIPVRSLWWVPIAMEVQSKFLDPAPDVLLIRWVSGHISVINCVQSTAGHLPHKLEAGFPAFGAYCLQEVSGPTNSYSQWGEGRLSRPYKKMNETVWGHWGRFYRGSEIWTGFKACIDAVEEHSRQKKQCVQWPCL